MKNAECLIEGLGVDPMDFMDGMDHGKDGPFRWPLLRSSCACNQVDKGLPVEGGAGVSFDPPRYGRVEDAIRAFLRSVERPTRARTNKV